MDNEPLLWSKQTEIDFFRSALKLTTPETLFYKTSDKRYYAYWPKSYNGTKYTLQARNAYIGDFTEKFCVDLLKNYAETRNLFAVQSVICNEIGLTPQSPADIAICKTSDRIQQPKNIVALFEAKMSIVWNWELIKGNSTFELNCLGSYNTHQGNPSLLRSDSMLKAIGKSITVRVSSFQASRIPIIIFGNTPISIQYVTKVDHLRTSGIIQGFWSLNPKPLDDTLTPKQSPKNCFIRMDSYSELVKYLDSLFISQSEFFSGMLPEIELGKIIELANMEVGYISKAQKFLNFIRGHNE